MNMDALAAFADKYGIGITILVVLIVNAKQIKEFLQSVISKISPIYRVKAEAEKKEQEHRRELEQVQMENVERERMDTILVFKDMMLEYRRRLDDNELELRRIHAQRATEIANYERLVTQMTGILQDVSETIRAQTDRLDKFWRYMQEQRERTETLQGHFESVLKSIHKRRDANGV